MGGLVLIRGRLCVYACVRACGASGAGGSEPARDWVLMGVRTMRVRVRVRVGHALLLVVVSCSCSPGRDAENDHIGDVRVLEVGLPPRADHVLTMCWPCAHLVLTWC